MKMAYPQGNASFIFPPHNLEKWMAAMKEIYTLNTTYPDFNQCFQAVTKDWDELEVYDFKKWLEFYQQNGQNKYAMEKQSQFTFPLDALRSTLPTAPEMPEIPTLSGVNLEEQRKQDLAKKIRAIISRLGAAEKLSTDPEVQRVLNKSLDIGVGQWLEELHRVKRLIQMVPLKNAATVEDLLIKEANKLSYLGFPKTAKLITKIAVDPLPIPTNPDPNQAGNETEQALTEIIEGMNPGEEEDKNEVMDMEDDPLASISIIAQELPAPTQAVPDHVEPNQTPVSEPAPIAENPEAIEPRDPFEKALENVTVGDVITELEALANIFRNREISRELAKIDLMMDRLGIASFFPSLAEANSKTLESNQYALTRVEDMLSKLRGSVKTPEKNQIDLEGDNTSSTEPSPNAPSEVVKQNLQQEQKADKARKEQRKQQQNQMEDLNSTPPAMPPVQVQPGIAPAPAV